MSESAGESSVTMDGFSVSSNEETPDEIRANLESEAKPLDGDPEKLEAERVSKAASELGKRGAKALAEKKAEAAKEKADESDESDDGAEPEKKAKPGSGNDLRLRMKALAAEKAEAARELATERAERQKLAAELAEARKPKTPEQPKVAATKTDDDEPKAGDFEDYAAYVKATAKYEAKQAFKARDEEAVKYQATVTSQRQQKEVQDFETHRETKFKEVFLEAVTADPSLAEVLKRIHPDLQGARTVYGAIKAGEPIEAKHFIADEFIDSEHPIEMARYFAQHQDEYERLAALTTPRAVQRAMAKVEAKLNSPSDAASTGSGIKDVASKAKAPVKPVTGSLSTASAFDVDDDTPFEEHFKRMNGRDRSRARGAAL